MRLIIDANRVFSVIIGKKLSSAAMGIFFSDATDFFTPFRMLAELENNREEIRFKSGFSHEDFDNFISIMKLRIKFMPLEDFMDKISDAKEISPHSKDIEYFALALKSNCAIWSDEKAFKMQSKVKVLTTSELINELGLK
ncbi:hypothetical protein J4480_05015 [Candidatus Woesearchaeota archaeon]|nr:hypothetical protein [Candidatus Woesearchaeota archaeon]